MAAQTIHQRQPYTVDLLYGDGEGAQRMISRFTVLPFQDDVWLAACIGKKSGAYKRDRRGWPGCLSSSSPETGIRALTDREWLAPVDMLERAS